MMLGQCERHAKMLTALRQFAKKVIFEFKLLTMFKKRLST